MVEQNSGTVTCAEWTMNITPEKGMMFMDTIFAFNPFNHSIKVSSF